LRAGFYKTKLVFGEEMETPKLLVIEDSPEVARVIYRGMSEEGFFVQIASNGEQGLRHLQEKWNLIILDLTLSDVPGEEVLEFIVQRPDHSPVLILTARDRLEDKVSLFKKGCDDYLVKPFALEELLQRVRALLRRPIRTVEKLEYQDLKLYPDIFQLTVGSKNIRLTPIEFSLCRKLLSEPGKIVTRRELLHTVWGVTHEPETNSIDVHVNNLRKKLGLVGRSHWLQTVRGSGLMFNCLENFNGS